MSSERKALLEKAFPEVLLFCRGLGLVFEVVDLHWGIGNYPFGDHEACEISLQEIQMCKRLSAGPNFIALLGNRYGHRALPRLISEKQFEVYLSKLSQTPEGIKQLRLWFRKDTNAVPPTYVLQPITDVDSWRFTETQLLQLLRSAASEAEAEGEITAEQKRSFYTSVTEQELEQGLWIGDHPPNALLFLRENPKQKKQKGKEWPKRLAKFMDATANVLLDPESQKLLAELKSQLYATSQKTTNLHCVELSRGIIDPKRKEHAQYLDSLCQQFISQMKTRIEAVVSLRTTENLKKISGNVEEDEDKLSLVLEEAKQHTTMTAELCEGLHGREGILGKICLAMWESGQKCHSPHVVHGAAGMGKTALLCKVVQEMQRVLETRVVLVIRFLAAHHPQRPALDQVLHSICLQVSSACGLVPPTPMTAGSPTELQLFFRNILEGASQQGYTLLIVLDALEQLAEQHHSHKLHWIPTNLPPKVHLLVSMDTCSEAFVNMRLKTDSLENFFEVERLSRDEGERIMESHLRASQRTLTAEQKDAALQSFTLTGCPLHLKLILSTVQNWTSFTPLTEQLLGNNTEEVMSQLLHRLEHKHRKELVGGALGYIALARDGLLEAELHDVMSLDDDVISEVYRYTHPPTPSLIRLPPLLWARLKQDLKDHLEERWTNGVAVIAFNHRCLSEVVLGHYLTSERQGRCHKILGEYFLGRWSGKLKPVALPGLSLLLSDRKVPPQPLWFAPGLANIRKLQALPHHLLHAGLWEELRQEVISMSYLCYGVEVYVIHDLDQCSQYMDCTETGLIRDALVLIKPGLDFLDGRMSLFYGELLARLSALSAVFPSLVGRLCSQINDWFLTCAEPVLIPKCSFLQQPGGALHHTLNTPNAGKVPRWSMLAAGAEDGRVTVWSLEDQQLLHDLLGHSGQTDVPQNTPGFPWGGGGHACSSAVLTNPGAVPVFFLVDSEGIQFFHHLFLSNVELNGSNPPPTGSLVERLAVSAEVSCLELAQHKRLLLCGLTSGTVFIYPLSLPQETLCIPPPESLSGVLCLAVSPQEKNLAVAYEDSVCLFEMATRDSFPTVEGPLKRFPLSLLHAPLSCMTLLPKRRLLYGTSCGGVVLNGFGGGISELQPHGSKVTCVTASNWGSHALVGSQDGVQRLGSPLPSCQGFFFHGVISAAFSESDQFVFTGSEDRTIKVWDVASGKLLFVQYVYSPVVRMETFRNGFAALTLQGSVIREAFRCPDHVSPDYNPLRIIKGQYRLTSRDKNRDVRRTSVSDLQHFNPAQFKLSLMGPLRAEPSSTCVLL
uniref:NACHT and WD repeat domain containing 1 n=1 Tax=Oryzias latipes TaxID=8090 RepID=A0A3P9GZX9_ORYLA